MTLDQLRYFIAAAKFEHVNRAAQSIPISASVISQSIKMLEDELSCKLFIREKRSIKLTDQGRRLLELSNNLLLNAGQIKQELGKEPEQLSGNYRIGASVFLAAKVLAPVWTKLQYLHPRLTADIHSQPTWMLVESILAGKIDFGIGFSPVPHPQLECVEIYRGHSWVVVRKSHPIFTRAKTNHYRFLKDYPATMHMASDRIVSMRPHSVLKALGLGENINLSFDNDYVALENLRKSDNWAFMIDVIAEEFKQHLRQVAIPRQNEAQYTIQIIKHKSRRLDPAMTEAFKLLRSYY